MRAGTIGLRVGTIGLRVGTIIGLRVGTSGTEGRYYRTEGRYHRIEGRYLTELFAYGEGGRLVNQLITTLHLIDRKLYRYENTDGMRAMVDNLSGLIVHRHIYFIL